MRILFLSNYYPPYSRGGYELWCQEVAEALTQRGHQVRVLTTKSGNNHVQSNDHSPWVERKLWPEVESSLTQTALRLLKDRPRLESENLQQLHKLVMEFQPEVALIWGMWNLPRSLPALLERLIPGQVAYYICDYWLTLPNAYIQRWQAPASRSVTQLPKRLLGKYFLADLAKETPIQLELEHPICVSQAVRDILVEAGIQVSQAQVIYGGVKPEKFLSLGDKRGEHSNKRLKLLYMGRLEPEKGVHTAINAIAHLAKEGISSLTLDIYGQGDPPYEAGLRTLVKKNNLDHQIVFQGLISHQQVPQVLRQYDVLIFPSEWQEPFARTVLEAMAAGLVVVGTTTGGTGEILAENKTGLTFTAGNAEQLADQIQRLVNEPGLRESLAKAGQRCVLQNFTLTQMVAQIEVVLFELASEKFKLDASPASAHPGELEATGVSGNITYNPGKQGMPIKQDIYPQ
jgi:glycogen synthase